MVERIPLKWTITEGQNHRDIGIGEHGVATVNSIDIPFFRSS